ncbi:SRPBCC domain-containing protein [Arthrobacter sp. ISL-5]|uniref:SRPBCC family protein n=1 Tax=Arthrobacter sp. ISL-5 TaxID=2819111 RepID=UPI001BE7E6E9|nr:SRPBCC domain-containing protein [Arthrobacter sp. ISL-5]MBT2553387.1 SRPBCC domain-containing protein [Arthrobacter sp. ISL-5]
MSTQQEPQSFTLSMEREFDAPRELVFKAFMDPQMLSAWFGPEGVDTPLDRIEVEPRVGGVWRMVMVYEEDGVAKESPIDSVIREYDPPRLLVASQLDSDLAEGQTHVMAMRLEFEDIGGRTLLRLTQTGFNSQEYVEMTREGWASSFTLLDAELDAELEKAPQKSEAGQ